MNQYAADQIAAVAALTQERKRARRWKCLAGLVVLVALAHQFSASVSLPPPLTRGAADVQRAVQPAVPTAKPVYQPSAAQSEPVQPPQPATSVEPTAEDRRREAAAAGRARKRYEEAVRSRQPRPVPQPPQRVAQPERIVPPLSRPVPSQPQRAVGLATVLMTAAQAARVAEQIERGRFNPSRELDRAARRMEREERRRRREERRLQRRW